MTTVEFFVRYIGKGIFILPYFFILVGLSGCTPPQQWVLTKIRTSSELADVNRITVSVGSDGGAITLEVRSENAYPVLYCSRATQTFKPLRGDSTLCEVTFSTSSETHRTIAHRLKGGQRLKLDTSTLEFLFNTLATDQPCHLVTGDEKITIPSRAFSRNYSRIAPKT
ncbi:hypothetical protein SCG7086_AD_00280 [Chlamydiales bacterium SCGC AG-110-P3]|nr:hypothetical protein SCG7086_AD_00280 [Chlamydiales bacterium SCGC AG-110-P3]